MTFWFSALSLAGCGAEFADNETVVSQAVGTTYGLDQFSRPACLLPEIVGTFSSRVFTATATSVDKKDWDEDGVVRAKI